MKRDKVSVEDVYNHDVFLDGLAVILSWTLFLPARLLAWIAKKGTK